MWVAQFYITGVGGVENTNYNGKSNINLVEKHRQECTESAEMDMNYQKVEKEFSLHFYAKIITDI